MERLERIAKYLSLLLLVGIALLIALPEASIGGRADDAASNPQGEAFGGSPNDFLSDPPDTSIGESTSGPFSALRVRAGEERARARR